MTGKDPQLLWRQYNRSAKGPGALLRVSGLWPTGLPGRRLLNCAAVSLAGSNPPQCWNCGSLGGPSRGTGSSALSPTLQPPDPTRDYFKTLQQRHRQLSALPTQGSSARGPS
uniref:Uncharacterized protein n=1 Tax=Moschus moschiferus TaxID=68415 RepID=A0A8C6E9N0_MOSMO